MPYNGTYNTDLVADQSFGFLDDAIEDGSPFFLTIAPMAPHSQVVTSPGESTKPVPKEKYADWFPDAKVPRKDNFNPDVVSSVSITRPGKADGVTAFWRKLDQGAA